MASMLASSHQDSRVSIPIQSITLDGNLVIPEGAMGLVLFAHGSGSSRHSPRNQYVANVLQEAGLATLLFDLLTSDEEVVDRHTRHLRFDIGLLAERLVGATDWLLQQPYTQALKLGYFGASTGAGAALMAAADRPDVIQAVVSRGGRPDLAGAALSRVTAPTLLVVGEYDAPVIEMNQSAQRQLNAPNQLTIVPRATHLFEEPGALEEVARLASEWFTKYFGNKD